MYIRATQGVKNQILGLSCAALAETLSYLALTFSARQCPISKAGMLHVTRTL